MGSAPPPLAEQAILASTTKMFRHCDIYEADSITPWVAGVGAPRLLEGTISIDYTRDERRSIDMLLDNSDNALRCDPAGLWYDKVLKVFQGVEYLDTTPIPTLFTRTNLVTNPKLGVNATGWSAAVGGTRVAQGAGWAWQVDGSVSSDMGPTESVSVAGQFWSGSIVISGPAGRTVQIGIHDGAIWTTTYFTVALTGAPQTVAVVSNTATTSIAPRMYVVPNATGGAWTSGQMLTATKALFEVVSGAGVPAGVYFDGASADEPTVNFNWTGTANASTSTQVISGAVASVVTKTWETQVGEFIIDRLDETNFPPSMKVVGRDYTKKCLISKFVTATAFAAGSTIESIIRAIATAAGITKFLLPVTGKVTGKDFFFERGTERWAAMKEIATAYSYDIYFNAQGYLVIHEYNDPVYAPLAYTFLTGPKVGNLVSFTKSANDSRLYNHIIVTGESSDSSVIPVSAEATNTDPLSPSRIARIGDRVYQYTSGFIETTAQAQAVALDLLRVSALEEYDINFTAITIPWLEVGTIAGFYDPNAGPTDPVRYLLSSLSIGLGLGPMSGNCKRVGIVG